MKIQVCTRCIMDNISDSTIRFSKDGTCNYCNYALSRVNSVYYPNNQGQQKLLNIIRVVKDAGKNKNYDCLMGISGGLDSTYLAFLAAKNWGLRILAVHVEDGFDTDLAQCNINNLCRKLNIDLIIEKPDSAQYTDLITAFFRAGLPGIAIPQDNVLVALLYRYARQYKLKYYLSGANFATESILQRGNGHVAADGAHIRSVHKEFGEVCLDNLPLITLFQRYIGYKYIYRIKTLRPLDLIDYNQERAIEELQNEVGFQYYGGKHFESIFTKFVQTYYLPMKFGVDKRKSHLSSLIISGQMNREEALQELSKPLSNLLECEITTLLAKLGLSRNEFDMIMNQAGHKHSEYKLSPLIFLSGMARKLRTFLSD